MQRWICRNCRQTTDTTGSYPVSHSNHCSKSGGIHQWVKFVVTQQPAHYICKYCPGSFNTQNKSQEELKSCHASPRRHHIFIKK